MADAQIDNKLAEGIAYFEQMLQAMPEDRTTLEFLTVAYAQAGLEDKCRDTLVALSQVLLKEKDFESALRIAERLDTYDTPAAKAAALKVRTSAGPAPDLTPEVPSAETMAADNTVSAIREGKKAELALVTHLLSRRVIDEQTADALVPQIESLPEGSTPFLVSVFAFLDRDNTALAEACAAHVADSTGCPPVPISAFEIPPKIVESVPEHLVRVRGVIPFAELGDELLVALVNPADEALRHSVNEAVGRTCRFFMCDLASAEAVVDKVFRTDAIGEGGAAQ